MKEKIFHEPIPNSKKSFLVKLFTSYSFYYQKFTCRWERISYGALPAKTVKVDGWYTADQLRDIATHLDRTN